MAGKPTKVLPPNQQAIRAAKAINDRQTEYAINGQRGLKLLVMPSGSAAFVFRYDYQREFYDRTRLKMGQLPSA